MVPLAYCEFILDKRHREGWQGVIGPAKCLNCQKALSVGATVLVRGGYGITADGTLNSLVEGATATVVEISAWVGEGNIFRIRLASDDEVYVARAQLGTADVEQYYLKRDDRAR